MAVSTMHTYLMKGTTSGSSTTWTRLICITDYPDVFNPPEQIDVTTLCDTDRKYAPGVRDTEALTFNCFYPGLTKFNELKAIEGVEGAFALWFGGTGDGETSTPSGDDGKFEFTGKPYFTLTGAGVNDPRGMSITIYPSGAVTVAASN